MAGMFNEVPSVEPLKVRERITRDWMLRSVGALLSLWPRDAHGALRNTEDSGGLSTFRPTATFHAITALAECAVWHPESRHDPRRRQLLTPHGEVSCAEAPPTALDVLTYLVTFRGKRSRGPAPSLGGWVNAIVAMSSHARTDEKAPSTRFIIPLERLVSAADSLMRWIPEASLDPLRPAILAGLSAAERRLRKLLRGEGVSPLNAGGVYESSDFAPGILLNIVTCFDALASAYRRLDQEKARVLRPEEIAGALKVIRDATIRHVDYHMARESVALDPSYDPVSLTFALRALCLASPEERRFAFFRACVQAIVARQHQDGCWPDGVSITFEATADVVQQPSAGVALHLAECSIDDRAVSDHIEGERLLLQTALPALQKTMQYLSATFTEVHVGDRQYAGWSSDRVRRRNYVETWITAYSTRLLRRLWIGEKAALRNHALMRFGISEHHGSYRDLGGAEEAWRDSVVEPDSITKPAELVWNRFVQPILRKRTAGDVFQMPRRDAVSFIIFGPPGSGKTFFVQRLADFLGWPLVTITPGHFIQRGLEFIEAVARDIFDHIRVLNHAVIFFDECDELFRTRDDEGQRGARSILSFATASMLPKLQDLHDAGNVIFVLGTNYLRNIDPAVRRPGRFDEVLLFDRPDDDARRRHICSALGGTASAALIRGTRGFTVAEIRRVAEAITMGAAQPRESSIDDYRDWCRRHGSGELSASRFDAGTRERIRRRWSAVKR